MAGLKDTFSKGITTINLKTANFVELNKIRTVNEQDAIDILTTISFLHKQLDLCIVVP